MSEDQFQETFVYCEISSLLNFRSS